MARTVRDAVTLGALTGVDPKDSKTSASTSHALNDYTPYLKKTAYRTKGLDIYPAIASNGTVDALVYEAVSVLEKNGAKYSHRSNQFT